PGTRPRRPVPAPHDDTVRAAFPGRRPDPGPLARVVPDRDLPRDDRSRRARVPDGVAYERHRPLSPRIRFTRPVAHTWHKPRRARPRRFAARAHTRVGQRAPVDRVGRRRNFVRVTGGRPAEALWA